MNPLNYWDHEPRARALMTREDVQKFIDFELMSKGVLKIEAPTLQEIVPVEIKTETFYKVQNGYYDVICFRTLEEANTFLTLHPFKSDYSYEAGSRLYYASPQTDLTIQPVSLATKADYMNALAQMKANQATETANAQLEKEFQESAKAMEDVTNGLFEDWHEQQATERRAQKIPETWNRYLAMSKHDPEIATQFLLKLFTAEDIQAAAGWLDPEAWDTAYPTCVKACEDSQSDEKEQPEPGGPGSQRLRPFPEEILADSLKNAPVVGGEIDLQF